MEYRCIVKYSEKKISWSRDTSNYSNYINIDCERESICPVELLLVSLGWCMVLTVIAVAENKKYDLKNAEININLNLDEKFNSKFEIGISLDGNLEEKARKILVRSAKVCKVHRMIAGKSEFKFFENQ